MKTLASNKAKSLATLVLVMIAGILSPVTWAQDTGWYVGGNVGQSAAAIDGQGITDGLLVQGFTVDSFTDDDRDLGFKLFAGYKLSRFFALQGGYFNLGKFTFDAETSPLGTYSGSIKAQGIDLDLMGIIPFTERFSAFGLVGANYARVKDTFSGTGFIDVIQPEFKKNDINIKYGLGLQFDVTEALSIRTQAERYRVNDAYGSNGDMDLYSVGLVYHFGGKAAPKSVAERPAVVKPEPKPEPKPVEVVRVLDSDNDGVIDSMDRCPNTPAGNKVNANGCPPVLMTLTGINFAYDSSSIDPKSEDILDRGVAALKEAETVDVRIVGHTDDRGSDTYNQWLSERRAYSVRDYFVRSGIPASRLTVSGAGESRPVASNLTDEGRAQNRRVELHVVD